MASFIASAKSRMLRVMAKIRRRNPINRFNDDVDKNSL